MSRDRISEILAEVREGITERRRAGSFPSGYETSIEGEHEVALGPIDPPDSAALTTIGTALDALRTRIAAVSPIESDGSSFRPWRFVRELAMSRHQLRRMNREMTELAAALTGVIDLVVGLHAPRPTPGEQAMAELTRTLYERTLVIERLIAVCSDLDQRLSALEGGTKT